MRTKSRLLAHSVLVLAAFISGCAPKIPIFLDSSLKPEAIGVITMLPVVDSRIEKKENINIQKEIREVCADLLDDLEYQVRQADTTGEAGEITEDALKVADAQWIRTLGPKDARWIMVIVFQDAASKMTFGSSGNAEVAGYLFDKMKGAMVWKDKGIGQAGQGGCIGMAMKGTMAGEALRKATKDLMAGFPPKPME